MDECELISLITAIACGITKCCTNNDMTMMSVIFTQLGDTLATVLAQREIKEDQASTQQIGEKTSSCNSTKISSDCSLEDPDSL